MDYILGLVINILTLNAFNKIQKAPDSTRLSALCLLFGGGGLCLLCFILTILLGVRTEAPIDAMTILIFIFGIILCITLVVAGIGIYFGKIWGLFLSGGVLLFTSIAFIIFMIYQSNRSGLGDNPGTPICFTLLIGGLGIYLLLFGISKLNQKKILVETSGSDGKETSKDEGQQSKIENIITETGSNPIVESSINNDPIIENKLNTIINNSEKRSPLMIVMIIVLIAIGLLIVSCCACNMISFLNYNNSSISTLSPID